MKSSIVCLAWVLLLSCNKYVSNTVFTNADRGYYECKKVLVIGVSPSGRNIEREIENCIIRHLSKSGIDAVSYVDASEMYSLATMSQDAVGFILEQNNVDYVLTVANINKSLAIPADQPEDLTDMAYFRHVLAYQSDHASPAKKIDRNKVWETILFDVHRCDASLVIQTNRLSGKDKTKEINNVTFHVAYQIAKVIHAVPPTRKGF